MSDVMRHLPEDVVMHIALYSGIPEIFALKQTCRSLYSTINSDYLWHQLLPREELPLDLPPSRSLASYNSLELQTSALRALKLQANWSKKSPQIHNLSVTNVKSLDGLFDELKLLNGATLLLGVRRDRHSQRPSMIVCVYSLQNVNNPSIIAQFSVTAIMKDFDACFEHKGSMLYLAATVSKMGTEVLEVFSSHLSLDNPTFCGNSYDTPYCFPLPRAGLFHKVTLQGNYLASTITSGEGVAPQILLANWKTRQQITVFLRFIDNLDKMDVILVPPFLAVVAASAATIQVTLVPLDIVSFGGHLELPSKSRTKRNSLPEFQTVHVPLMDFYDVCISDNMNTGQYAPPTSLSLIVFPTLSRLESRQGRKALFVRFAIDPVTGFITSGVAPFEKASIMLDVVAPFNIPFGSYPEHARLGTTGRRAVWLEQSLKSDYVRMVRLDYDPLAKCAPSVEVLLPPDPQLPFKPSACRALAFDEATGRLCLGTYNGSIYILDYYY